MPFHFNAVIKAMKDAKYKRISGIKSDEWSILQDYSDILRPIAIALDKMQSEKDGSAGHIMPTLFYLEYQFTRLKEAVIEAFHARFNEFICIKTANKNLIVASVSHPKYKLKWIIDYIDKNMAEEMFIKECRVVAQDIGCLENVAPMMENTFYDQFIANEIRQEENIHFMDEISRFLGSSSQEIVALHDNTVIRKVFRKFNTTISSSAPIERLFSQGPMIFTAKRKSDFHT